MPRISGINIPDNKAIEYSLPYIYGVGLSNARVILKTAHVALTKKAKDLSAEEVNKIQSIIDKNYKVEGDLRRDVSGNIKRLKDIGAWRGMRAVCQSMAGQKPIPARSAAMCARQWDLVENQVHKRPKHGKKENYHIRRGNCRGRPKGTAFKCKSKTPSLERHY